MFKIHPKDSLTFKVIDADPAKNTVTVTPTFGTLMKFNVTAGALIYVTVLVVRQLIDDRRESDVDEKESEHS